MKKFKIFINYAISISLMIIPAFLTQDYLFNALKYIDNSSIAYLISFFGYLLFLFIPFVGQKPHIWSTFKCIFVLLYYTIFGKFNQQEKSAINKP